MTTEPPRMMAESTFTESPQMSQSGLEYAPYLFPPRGPEVVQAVQLVQDFPKFMAFPETNSGISSEAPD